MTRGALRPAGNLKRYVLLPLLVTVLACSEERAVTVYSPLEDRFVGLVTSDFGKAYPGIDRVRRLGWRQPDEGYGTDQKRELRGLRELAWQQVYDRIRLERDNLQADVWFGEPAAILSRAAREGLLEPYRPPWADALSAESQHPDDLYFGLYRNPLVLVYNSDALTPEEAPQDWDDLLQDRWRGQIAIRHPGVSWTTRTFFGVILARSVAETGGPEAGFAWLRRFDGQIGEYLLDERDSPCELVIRQEALITIWELPGVMSLRRQKAPLDYRFPKSGTPFVEYSVGLLKGAPNPDDARTFLDWIGSISALTRAAQEAFRLPVRSDLPNEALPGWWSFTRLAPTAQGRWAPAAVDWSLVEERSDEWLATWERTTGGSRQER